MINTKIIIGSDRAGYEMKASLKAHMTEKGIKFLDLGCFEHDIVDYVDVAREVCERVLEDKSFLGVLICSSGVGMMMAGNKIEGIRAAACTHELMAQMARKNGDANVLALGAKIITVEDANKIFDVYFDTQFEDDRSREKKLKKFEGMATRPVSSKDPTIKNNGANC